jgi:hypothetical protein
LAAFRIDELVANREIVLNHLDQEQENLKQHEKKLEQKVEQRERKYRVELRSLGECQ